MISFVSTIEDPDDRAFMEHLYHNFERLIYATTQRYISERTNQNDVAQEVIIKLIAKIGTIRSMNNRALSSYIVSTTRSTSIDFLRSKKVIAKYVVELDGEGFSEPEPISLTLDEMMILSEENTLLRKILENLNEEERLLLEGKYFMGYTDKELALRFGCKSNSIRMKLTRARRRVFEEMNRQGTV